MDDKAAEPGRAAAERILIVLHDFAGGGTEHVAVRLANGWATLGRRVRIFCGAPEGPVLRMVAPSVQITEADPPLPRGPLSRLRLGHALAQEAAAFRPDVVFAPGNFHLPVLAAFAQYDRSGAATICKISNPLVKNGTHGLAGLVRRQAVKVLTSRVDQLVAMSPALRRDVEQIVGAARVASRWEPIFYPSDAYAEEPTRDPCLIVAAGRLEPQKNFALAIEAMAHVARWSDATLVILGEGSERSRLERLIDVHGLHGRVQLPGHVPDVRPWLRRAACFLMTSRFEGYPAILAEAAACGVPALATPCSPAVKEILSLCALGAVVEPDAGALACAIRNVLQRPRYQRAQPMLLARHEAGRAAASYLDLLDQVRARQKSRDTARAGVNG